MKKLLAVVLAVAVVGCLAACGQKPAPEPAGSGSGSAAPTEKAVNVGMDAVYGPNGDQYWSAYDEIIKKVKTTADMTERASYMYEAESWIKDTWTILPLYYYTNPYLCSTSLKDYIYSPLGWVSYKYAYMDTGLADITVNFSSDPETMDPALNSSVDGAVMLTNSFAGLYGYDTNMNIIPECAEEVVAPTALDGGKYQYVIKLKDGLKWSDGVDMKASDFEYAWKRAADPATAADYQYMFDVIDGYSDDETCNLNVTADDAAGTITIVTSAYCAYFDQLMAFPTYFPVRKDVVENDSWATSASTYVSNGPFRMKDWTVGSEIVFEKNPNYWDAANVKLNTIKFFLSNDDDAIYANFTNGTIQYTTTVPVSQIPVLKADPTRMNVDFFIGDYIGTYFLEVNVNWSFKPGLAVTSDTADAWEGWTPAQNAEVRHALALLIDRNYIVEQVTAGGQLPAYGFVPAGMDDGTGTEFRSATDPWWSVDPADYQANVAEAVEILKKYYTFDEATGKFTDFPKFEYSANPTSGNLAICAAIQDMWDDYGIEIEVDQRDWAVIQTALTAGDFTLSRLGWIADYNDPVNFLEILVSASGNNHPHLGKSQS